MNPDCKVGWASNVIRRRVISVITGGLALSALTAIPAHALEGLQNPNCTSASQSFLGYLYPDGSVSNIPSPSAGKIYELSTTNGVTVNQILPPAGFNPLTATNQQLDVFAFPPKPSGGAPLAAWTAEMAQWSGSAPVGMCTIASAPATMLQAPDGQGNGPLASFNWSGVWSTYGSYTKTSGYTIVPSHVGCPNTSGEFTWVGLGGAAQKGLLQTGQANFGSASNNVAWWEAIAPNPNDPSTHVDTGFQQTSLALNLGDLLAFQVTYKPEYPRVDFWQHNRTTGKSVEIIRGDGLLNLPISAFYDGSTADWIVEKPYPDLRQWSTTPGFNSTYAFTAADSSWHTAGDDPHKIIDIYKKDVNDRPTIKLDTVHDDQMTDTISFSVDWIRCE